MTHVHNKFFIKEEDEDYTWGYGQNSLDYPNPWVPFSISSVDPIFSNSKTILVISLIFHIFTRVENQPLKRRLKQERRIFFTNLQNVFSFA